MLMQEEEVAHEVRIQSKILGSQLMHIRICVLMKGSVIFFSLTESTITKAEIESL